MEPQLQSSRQAARNFRVPDSSDHVLVLLVDTRRKKKLLCGLWVRDLVAVGEGRQERNKGIFLPVCELKVPQLSFVEVG